MFAGSEGFSGSHIRIAFFPDLLCWKKRLNYTHRVKTPERRKEKNIYIHLSKIALIAACRKARSVSLTFQAEASGLRAPE